MRRFLQWLLGERLSPERKAYESGFGFWQGFGSVLDIGGTMGPEPEDYPSLTMTDAEALASDWRAVGDDLREAMSFHGLKSVVPMSVWSAEQING